MKRERGFTLLEVLIVVVLLGAAAALAVPNYLISVEKGIRKQEAVTFLSAVRDSQIRNYSLTNAFATTYTALDFDPSSATIPGSNPHFTYGAPVVVGTTWTAVATRNSLDRPTGVGAWTVTINENGVLTTAGI